MKASDSESVAAEFFWGVILLGSYSFGGLFFWGVILLGVIRCFYVFFFWLGFGSHL